jgi:hypothetical protein
MKASIISFAISVTFLMPSAPVLAQSANTGGQTPGSSAANGEAKLKTRQTPIRETTTTGCLLSQNGKYILVTSKQASILQLVPAPILEAHVGQKVKITGTFEARLAAPPATTESPVEPSEPHVDDDISASDYLRVRKLKKISGLCDGKGDDQKSWIRILSL